MTVTSPVDTLDVAAIRLAWNRSTSASPEQWSARNRARGQCAITACVVQDCLGGRIIRTEATLPGGNTESHYANLLEHDVILDLTESQFPEGTVFGSWEERTREYVLGFPTTNARYLRLVQRLNELRTLQKVQAAGLPA